MSLPPYWPNSWAAMMAQQQVHAQAQAQAQLAAAQAAHVQAAAQQAAQHAAHLHAMSGGPPLPQTPKQPEIISEDKLQEKGTNWVFIYQLTFLFFDEGNFNFQ